VLSGKVKKDNLLSDVSLQSEFVNEKKIVNFDFKSNKNRELKLENNSNFYINKDNHVDYLFKLNTKLGEILSFKESKVQGGLIYRHTGQNFLANLNFCHDLGESSSIDLEKKSPDNKIKFGFVKQHSFSNDLEVIFGSRMNVKFQGLGSNLEFDKIKARACIIHRDASAYLNFTKPVNSPLEKIKSNFLVKLLPGLNIFGQAEFLRDMESKEDKYVFSLGNHIEYGKKSEFKVKITNQKEAHFALKRKINENMELNFMGNLRLKEISGGSYGKIESNFGFNMTYGD